MKNNLMPRSCDIFCNVIDNYGDIGVSWRLARQLANEFGLQVRLWVDDLASFVKLCPEADASLDSQRCRGVEVRLWNDSAFNLNNFLIKPLGIGPGGDESAPKSLLTASSFPRKRESSETTFRVADKTKVSSATRKLLNNLDSRFRGNDAVFLPNEQFGLNVIPADLVIDAFGCTLPPVYLAAMAIRDEKPVWINLEYLSAEAWVEGCHKLPSPKPPLTRYFFFPGFTNKTGGLLLERDLLARRDAFCRDPMRQEAFWSSIGMAMPPADTLKISLFAYENAALSGLFDVWADGAQAVLCLVPEGRILPQVLRYFADDAAGQGACYKRGNLEVRVLPFVEQERYDELLWVCDVNFVRGEDSCVRAQWAGKPFVWQIYPQHDAVHWEKLQAFLNRYGEVLGAEAVPAMQGLWQQWNDERDAGQAWLMYANRLGELNFGAQVWAQQLSSNNLALNLLDFSQEIATMCAFKIDG
jgi:uncharacterized repeat protein (TIGR03837 family)